MRQAPGRKIYAIFFMRPLIYADADYKDDNPGYDYPELRAIALWLSLPYIEKHGDHYKISEGIYYMRQLVKFTKVLEVVRCIPGCSGRFQNKSQNEPEIDLFMRDRGQILQLLF